MSHIRFPLSRVFAILTMLLSASVADAQILQRVKKETQEKITKQRQRLDSTVVHTAGKAVDSSLSKTSRGTDAVLGRTGSVIDTAINRTERGVASLVQGDLQTGISSGLASGRLVATGIRFAPATSELLSESTEYLSMLAEMLKRDGGPFLVESHVKPVRDASADQALSAKRALALKTSLVALGVAPDRLFAMGYGSSTPLQTSDNAQAGPDRIEIARIQ